MLNYLPTNWQIKTLGEVLNYEQPTKYIVKSTKYNGSYKTPVLTAGKSFILGYTDELKGIFTQIPVIIFDDFTTDTKFVDFKFKVKSSAMKILHSKENADIKFIYYFMQTIRHRSDTHKRYWISEYAKIKIPLPPLEIQKRIVARLESAFEKIEKGSAHLQNAKAKLAKYKQSLLKSAFDGTLFCHTESEARSISNQEFRDISLTLNMTNSPSLRANEASVAIQNNDTTKALDCHKSANANFHNDDKSVDCHDLTSSNLAMTDKENPKLPQGWTIKTLGEIAQIKGGKRLPKDAKYAETITPYPYIRVTDFENMSVNMTNLKYLTKEVQQKIKNYTISKDDIYISIAGSIGKVGIIPDKLHNANLTENAAKIVHSMDKKYLAFYLNSSEVQSQIAFFTKATTQPKLALYRIENLKIKIPPLEIQKQIVKLLEKHLQHADKTGKFIESALNKAKQLKQSLLKSAFLGELV